MRDYRTCLHLLGIRDQEEKKKKKELCCSKGMSGVNSVSQTMNDGKVSPAISYKVRFVRLFSVVSHIILAASRILCLYVLDV